MEDKALAGHTVLAAHRQEEAAAHIGLGHKEPLEGHHIVVLGMEVGPVAEELHDTVDSDTGLQEAGLVLGIVPEEDPVLDTARVEDLDLDTGLMEVLDPGIDPVEVHGQDIDLVAVVAVDRSCIGPVADMAAVQAGEPPDSRNTGLPGHAEVVVNSSREIVKP